MYNLPLAQLTPEAINALVIAGGTSLSALIVAYFTAKKQRSEDTGKEANSFRDALADDNESLREEIRDLKQENHRLAELNRKLDAELWQIYQARRARGEPMHKEGEKDISPDNPHQ